MPCNKCGGFIQHPVWTPISLEEARQMNATGHEAVYIKATGQWVIGHCEICNGIQALVSEQHCMLHRKDKKGLEVIREHLARLRAVLEMHHRTNGHGK